MVCKEIQRSLFEKYFCLNMIKVSANQKQELLMGTMFLSDQKETRKVCGRPDIQHLYHNTKHLFL